MLDIQNEQCIHNDSHAVSNMYKAHIIRDSKYFLHRLFRSSLTNVALSKILAVGVFTVGRQ